MTLITIPFSPEMTRAILDGYKCCTTRSKRYGNPGDRFQLEGQTYRILDIKKHTLIHISSQLYRLEGFVSEDEFIAFWKHLHRGNYNPWIQYNVHFFARVMQPLQTACSSSVIFGGVLV